MSTSDGTPAITGKTLGAFEVGELLGEGGMGAVFHGRDKALDRPVAIKVLHTKLAADDEFVERFVREARTAAKLNHANVVQIYGAGYDGGIAYMALELVEGCSLFDLYKAQRPFPPRRACELIRDVSRGLAVAHEQGVIHRDIKPENILISEKGVPKLADFGLARGSNQRITETGVFLGTPQYASPEQCNAAELTPASDLYSLGVVLYELLAGRPPYEAPTPLTLFKKILMEAPEPLENYCPGLPPSLVALIGRLLEKEPASRYGDAAVLAADLDRVLQGLPEVSSDMDPYKLVPIVRADSRTVQTPASDSSRSLPFQESRGTTPLTPSGEPSDLNATLRTVQLALAAVATVLLCAVIGLGLARLRKSGEQVVQPSPAAVKRPLRVAVIPWANQAGAEDFDWLGRALPDFLVSELSQRPDAILVEAPANVGDAAKGMDLSDPSQRRQLAKLLNVDLVIGGSFYVAPGGQVALNAQVETVEGVAKQIPGSPATFPKDEVLGALNQFASSLASAIAGPQADTTSVVAMAPSDQGEAQTARAKRNRSGEAQEFKRTAGEAKPAAQALKELEESTEAVLKKEDASEFAEKRLKPSAKRKQELLHVAPTKRARSEGGGGGGGAGRKGSAGKAARGLESDENEDWGPNSDEGDGMPRGAASGGEAKDEDQKASAARSRSSLEETAEVGGKPAGAEGEPSAASASTPRPSASGPRTGALQASGSQPAAAEPSMSPKVARLRSCLSKGAQWEIGRAFDACLKSEDRSVFQGTREALEEDFGVKPGVLRVLKARLRRAARQR